MKVELEKTFPLAGSADVGWAVLQNIEAVATCMPGAKIAERLSDGRYKGTVTVRIGPASMSFRGELEVRDLDAVAHSLRLVGKGTDSTGTSAASMDLTARIEPVGELASNLVGKSEVTMSGKAAAFGARMMSSVADQILGQFAKNFATQVTALDAQRTAAADVQSARSATPSASPPPAARELNGLALIWAVIKDWLRGLFGKTTA